MGEPVGDRSGDPDAISHDTDWIWRSRGVLLADMVPRGEVSLDDPLSRHLPGLRPAWRHREPTLLELATHRSALPNTRQ